MSNWIEWAKKEIERAGLYKKGGLYDGMVGESLGEVIRILDKQGHSGFSMSLMRKALSRLMGWEPLTPLTGKDEEWVEIKEGLWQNSRCPRVFKNNKGEAWDVEGKIFVEPNGDAYTCADSKVFISFPYVPKSEYIHVQEERNG